MKFERFEDIMAWQKGRELTVSVYRIFSECKDFAFKDQIQRSSVSVMNNIAEGFERRFNNTFNAIAVPQTDNFHPFLTDYSSC